MLWSWLINIMECRSVHEGKNNVNFKLQRSSPTDNRSVALCSIPGPLALPSTLCLTELGFVQLKSYTGIELRDTFSTVMASRKGRKWEALSWLTALSYTFALLKAKEWLVQRMLQGNPGLVCVVKGSILIPSSSKNSHSKSYGLVSGLS